VRSRPNSVSCAQRRLTYASIVDHPYANLPDSSFWRRAVSSCASAAVHPATHVPCKIGPQDPVATAGSCFAQHLSRTLAKSGYNFLVTEPTPQTPGALDEGFGVDPARFGNIYTVAQLLQLFERAYGIFAPRDEAWQREDG